MPPKPHARVSPFLHPWFDNWDPDAPQAQPLNHWRMQEISNAIRAKPQWKLKYKTPQIVSKWREEVRQQLPDVDIVDKLFDYVLKELEWVERVESEYPGLDDAGFTMLCDDKIVGSLSAVDDKTRSTLVDQVQRLYDSFGEALDFHPGSNDKVIDLVHPSLFPVEYGTTVARSGDHDFKLVEFTDEIPAVKGIPLSKYGVSKRFQWLPSVLSKNNKGEYKFSSYINNLHPVNHADLYETLATIFNKTLPGLSFTLARFASPTYYRLPKDLMETLYNTNGKTSMWEHMNDLEQQAENDPTLDFDELWEDRIKLCMREVYEPYTNDPEMSEFDITDFKDLKVITKLANIELSPSDPTYPGGSWHVEGTVNEDIIATVIYYFDNENITESKLSFRTAFSEPWYEQGDDLGCEHVFGIKDGDRLLRNLGDVTSETNKCVIWPNIYQHHVDPFELKDKTKPGHRKILCFFICDPYNEQLVSTKEVPYQDKSWWDDASLTDLSQEDKEKIIKLTEGKLPLTLQQALKVREELMQERSVPEPGDEYDDESFGARFSLCEH